MEIMFYYRLKGENFLRHDLYYSIKGASIGMKYLKSRIPIEESCIVLIGNRSLQLETYQEDEAIAARAARKSDEKWCEKRAIVGIRSLESMRALRRYMEAVEDYRLHVPFDNEFQE